MPQVDIAPIHNEAGNMAIYTNVDQEFIFINVDRVKIIFEEYRKVIKRKVGWVNPSGVFLSLLTAFMTTDFTTEKFGIPPSIMEKIFIIISAGVCLWLSVELTMMCKYRKKGAVEKFLERIKGKNQFITTPAKESPLVPPPNIPKIRQTKKKMKNKKKRKKR
ncbi:MAG: hypothetical protein LBD87_05075 [Prevotellaceae bacterium]|jgi:hypothetical protein|nr:hypothetical protein [Prevotellaceae bacterium]